MVCGLLIEVGSLVVEHGSGRLGLSSWGWQALEPGFGSCGARVQQARSKWNLPRLNPGTLLW